MEVNKVRAEDFLGFSLLCLVLFLFPIGVPMKAGVPWKFGLILGIAGVVTFVFWNWKQRNLP